MISRKNSLLLIYLTCLSLLLVISFSSSSNSLNVTECNVCHGPSASGHIIYSVALGMTSAVENKVPTTLTATVINTDYPLSDSSVTLSPSADYSIINNPDKITLGVLDRGSTTKVQWTIQFHVDVEKTTQVSVSFQGTAISHTTHTYTQSYSKSVFVSTKPRPILDVQSTPLSDSTIYVGSGNNTGEMTVKNSGTLPMTNVTVTTAGPVLVNSENKFIIPLVDKGQSANFNISIDTSKSGTGSIIITYNGDIIQKSIITIYIQPNPANAFTLFLGRIFGYTTFTLLFLSVFTGAGTYHLKKYISGRKIRILHSDLANLAFTMVVIHAMILTIPDSPWSNVYYFFELIPERIPTDQVSLGLFLGRLGLVLMYISVISGFFIAKLIKKFGRSVGISIHMLSYVALVIGLIHVSLLGGLDGFAHQYPVIILILLTSVLSIGWLKWDTKRELARKKAERTRKRLLAQQEKEKQFNSMAKNVKTENLNENNVIDTKTSLLPTSKQIKSTPNKNTKSKQKPSGHKNNS
ncbi:MAG: hypothetical protein ACFFD1_12100 [Candidatus Thorarchaeota archaeon]